MIQILEKLSMKIEFPKKSGFEAIVRPNIAIAKFININSSEDYFLGATGSDDTNGLNIRSLNNSNNTNLNVSGYIHTGFFMERDHLIDFNVKEIFYLVMKESIFSVLNAAQPLPNGLVSSLILKNNENGFVKSNISVNLLFRPTEVNFCQF